MTCILDIFWSLRICCWRCWKCYLPGWEAFGRPGDVPCRFRVVWVVGKLGSGWNDMEMFESEKVSGCAYALQCLAFLACFVLVGSSGYGPHRLFLIISSKSRFIHSSSSILWYRYLAVYANDDHYSCLQRKRSVFGCSRLSRLPEIQAVPA